MADSNPPPPPPLPHPSPRGGGPPRYYYQVPNHQHVAPSYGHGHYYNDRSYPSPHSNRHYESPRHAYSRSEQGYYHHHRQPPPPHPPPSHPLIAPPHHDAREREGMYHHQTQYPQPRGGLAPSKSGAFVRYRPQPPSVMPRREEERDAHPDLVETRAVAVGGGGVEVREEPEEVEEVVRDEKVENVKDDSNKRVDGDDVPSDVDKKKQAEEEETINKEEQQPVKMDQCPVVNADSTENKQAKASPDETKIQHSAGPTESQMAPAIEPLLTKRPRSEPNVDDNTPKAGAYRHGNHHATFFPMNNQMMYQQRPPNKRTRPNEEFYPRHHYNDKYQHSLRPIMRSSPPTTMRHHRRSFSLESAECRQDKTTKHEESQATRFRPASYSPSNSLVSRRSFDFYEDENRSQQLSINNSWTMENGLRSRSMSWEVPPALSAICSFGQLNNDSLKSPGESLQRGGGGSPRREDHNLPSIPANDKFMLAPRPLKEDGRMEEGYYRHHLPVPRDYYPRSSPPRSRRERYVDDRYYEMADGRYRKEVRRSYEPPLPNREMDVVVDRRDPYESQRKYRRFEEQRHGSRSPPPSLSRDAYFYPNETPGGLSSRSFDSRSLGEMDEPVNSLLYRPSFSWERGLDVAAPAMMDYDHQPHQPHQQQPARNAILVQLSDQQRIMKALALRNEIRTIGNPHSSIGLILLLAMPNDRHCLSETLCIIRNNVEVFTATAADISAPAPGRKRPVQVGQVGLRCVYCRMCTNDRVKRAMCFPSSTKRIYRALIDMKLDHFPSCPYIPQGLKARLEELSANSGRSTGMTVQYFVKSAKELGMVDMEEGMFIDLTRVGKEEAPYFAQQQPPLPPPELSQSRMGHAAAVPKSPASKAQFKPHKPPQIEMDPNITRYHGKVLLAFPDDSSFLSPLRCFLRRNVCAFTATSNDIAVRTPTTFSVRVGQVGVGCVHCLSVPPKQRSNRAVCFPFTLARIYQSVADIQRFHLGECKMMPPDVRAEFLQLQSESAKGSRGLATRTYWIDSARKLGLADGPCGMYFSRDPTLPPLENDESLDLLAQVATNANTNFKPLVTPEDKPTIAEFLYVVMEQLQPCLFTDADRNKRRSKNLGSIGVECKHCAGKIDARKFFWSSVSAAESNFVSVHSHMMDCKYIPDDFKKELATMKALRREQTSRLKTGSQKAFFTRVWNRLHSKPDDEKPEEKPKTKTKRASSKPDAAPVSSSAPEMPPALPPSKSMDDTPFDSMVLPSGGSNDELRALLESKSTLSSMPSIEELKPEEIMEAPTSEDKPDVDSKMVGSGDSAIAIKSSMSSVAHELSAVSVRSKEAEQDAKSVEV